MLTQPKVYEFMCVCQRFRGKTFTMTNSHLASFKGLSNLEDCYKKKKEGTREKNQIIYIKTQKLPEEFRYMYYTDATENLFYTQIKTVIQRAGRSFRYKRLCSHKNRLICLAGKTKMSKQRKCTMGNQ